MININGKNRTADWNAANNYYQYWYVDKDTLIRIGSVSTEAKDKAGNIGLCEVIIFLEFF